LGPLGAQRLQTAQSALVAAASGGDAVVRPFGLELDRALELAQAGLLLGQKPLGPGLELAEALIEHAQLAAIEPPDGAADRGEEGAVVADHNESATASGKVLLEALDGRQVEVIGGLIEQEDIGRADQDARKIDPPGLAA
jgi:hypothetical protein